YDGFRRTGRSHPPPLPTGSSALQDRSGEAHSGTVSGGPGAGQDRRPPDLAELVLELELAVDSAAMNASCGTSTRPTIFIRFLPSFCRSSSLRFRVTSPP